MSNIITFVVSLIFGIILPVLLYKLIAGKKDSPHRHNPNLSRIKDEIAKGIYVVDGKKIAVNMLGKSLTKER